MDAYAYFLSVLVTLIPQALKLNFLLLILNVYTYKHISAAKNKFVFLAAKIKYFIFTI
jgi:hypothetical protein